MDKHSLDLSRRAFLITASVTLAGATTSRSVVAFTWPDRSVQSA